MPKTKKKKIAKPKLRAKKVVAKKKKVVIKKTAVPTRLSPEKVADLVKRLREV